MPKNEFICDCTAVHEDVVELVNKKMQENTSLEKAAQFFKIFGDNTRIKILWALEMHEMCVCDIANVLSMTKSAVSHQLAILRKADIVRCRRDFKTVYYSLSDDHVRQIIEKGFEHVNE